MCGLRTLHSGVGTSKKPQLFPENTYILRTTTLQAQNFPIKRKCGIIVSNKNIACCHLFNDTVNAHNPQMNENSVEDGGSICATISIFNII